MSCITCIYSSYRRLNGLPSIECQSCRVYSNHATELPAIGGELIDEADVDAACYVINQLTHLVMFGDGEQCTKASRLLSMIGKAMTLNVHGGK